MKQDLFFDFMMIGTKGMKTAKRILIMLLCAALLLALPQGALASPDMTAQEKADALFALGLFKGTGKKADGTPDYALDGFATRDAAATMLIRLMGREAKAKAQYDAGALACPFVDTAGWAAANVTWLYESGYVNGTGGNTFSGSSSITARQFAAMILRALGYSEANGDFRFTGALDFAVSRGLLTQAQSDAWSGDFRRAGMVEMCYNALYLPMRDSRITLLEKLTNDGIFKPSYDLGLADTAPIALTLLYAGGGSVSRWSVEEPASADPVCADVDGDGKPEIIFAVRTIHCLDAASGKIKWMTPSGHDVSEQAGANDWFGAAVLSPLIADYDGGGDLEILTFSTNYVKDQTFVGIYDWTGTAPWSSPSASAWGAAVTPPLWYTITGAISCRAGRRNAASVCIPRPLRPPIWTGTERRNWCFCSMRIRSPHSIWTAATWSPQGDRMRV